MASKQPLKIFDLKKGLYKMWLNSGKFVKHTLLRNKKQVCIVGEEDTPFCNLLKEKMKDRWEIVQINCKFDSLQVNSKTKQSKQNNNKQQANHFHNISKLFLTDSNHTQIENTLSHIKFDSIIVLPSQDESLNSFDVEDQNFVTKYPIVHHQSLLKNVFAYRLAHKCLDKSGIIIMSASQREFLKEKKQEKPQNTKLIDQNRKYWISNQILNAQVSYLGVIIGDRDYTDLSSYSVIALSEETVEKDPQIAADYYLSWADNQRRPEPGSFALFKNPTLKSKVGFVEYL